ncbi:hypothetical protein HWV62_23510 [Athelia sp. TMB]|nr:hypothetical protein HWV62_23510 [Athelia sp. TMB]
MEVSGNKSMTPETTIRALVCERCWNTPFSADAFHKAWKASDSSDAYSYAVTWNELQDSANRGCNWCKFLSAEIPSYVSVVAQGSTPDPQQNFDVKVRFIESKAGESPSSCNTIGVEIDGVFPFRLEVCTAHDDSAAWYIKARDALRRVSAPTSYIQALECLAVCADHDLCPKPAPTTLPTRLVDCSDPKHPRLVTTGRAQGTFAALSYVWGTSQPHCTRMDNIETYMRGIDICLIPQTIKDAIASTHKLGLQYLWVDALCIIQDDRQDKRSEIRHMRHYYEDAYVALTAASAPTVNDGFLQDRPAPSGSFSLPFRCPDGVLGTMSSHSPEPERTEPVDTRAWCLEERLIPPRTLRYTSTTLQYTCRTHIMNVGDSNISMFRRDMQLPLVMFRAPNTSELSRTDQREILDAWGTVLAAYTERALTHPQDRFIAVSGIVDLFSKFWGETYVAGLWRDNLLEGLLWQQGDLKNLPPRPKTYRAPSWSWGAVDGRITPAFAMHFWGEDKPECEILECEVELAKDDHPFGEVTGGQLRVRALLKKVLWNPRGWKIYDASDEAAGAGSQCSQAGLVAWEQNNAEPLGSAYPDSAEDASMDKSEVFALPIRSSVSVSQCVQGLIVVPGVSLDDMACYRRVGVFEIPMAEPLKQVQVQAWLQGDIRVITIL